MADVSLTGVGNKQKPGDVMHSSPGNAFVLLGDGTTWVRIWPEDRFVVEARETVWKGRRTRG
jgi:hypothetical protein